MVIEKMKKFEDFDADYFANQKSKVGKTVELPDDDSQFEDDFDEDTVTPQPEVRPCVPVDVWFSIQNGGDGSAYPDWFLTEEEAERDQENMYEGWGESCTGRVETYEGSNIHQKALKNVNRKRRRY